MSVRPLWIVCGTVAYTALLARTPLRSGQSDEKITPSQAKAMFVRFMQSEDGAKLRVRFMASPSFTPFIDPHSGWIRLEQWRVDPVTQTVLLPRPTKRIEGSFVKDGAEYVIKDAREVEVSWIKPEEAKVMILRFLSSAEAAKLPAWVAESRKGVEASRPIKGSPRSQIIVGSWFVDPYVGAVVLPTDT
jgi:hypothetical protein